MLKINPQGGLDTHISRLCKSDCRWVWYYMNAWTNIRKAKGMIKTRQNEIDGFPGSDMNEQKL